MRNLKHHDILFQHSFVVFPLEAMRAHVESRTRNADKRITRDEVFQDGE